MKIKLFYLTISLLTTLAINALCQKTAKAEDSPFKFTPTEQQVYQRFQNIKPPYSKIPGLDNKIKGNQAYGQFLKILHGSGCPCGCQLSLLQCRNEDSSCGYSKPIVEKLHQSLYDQKPFYKALQTPDFTIKFINHQSKNYRLHHDSNKVKLLVFWATWCHPCMLEIPHLNDLYKKYPDITIIGLNVDDQKTQKKLATIIKEHNIKYPVAVATAQTQKDYYTDNLPTSVYVDQFSVFRLKQIGLQTKQTIEANIKNILHDSGNDSNAKNHDHELDHD